MKTSEERKVEFQKDYDNLLEKHGATVEISEYSTDDFGGLSQEIEVWMESVWVGDECVAGGSMFKLDR